MSECVHCGTTDDIEHGVVVGLHGELNESTCNVCLADHLHETTVLSRREADVAALKELGAGTHAKIATLLDIKKSTVDEYARRINTKRDEARETVAFFGEQTAD